MEDLLTRKQTPHLVIEPSMGWRMLDLRELWHYRDLLLTLAVRDVKLRYRQTALGPIWVLLGPLLSAGIFSFVFGKVAKLPSEGVPYFLFVFAGQIAWNAFNGVVNRTSGSLVGNQQLVSKIYFPRMILPLSSVFAVLIDFAVALAMMAVLMALSGIAPHGGLLLLPVFLSLMLLFALGIGLIVSALMVTYRDAGNFLGPILSVLMYGSPVLYAIKVVPENVLPFYYLNPMASLVQAFRWSLLNTSIPPWGYLCYAAIFVSLVLVLGAFVFNRMERRFADVI